MKPNYRRCISCRTVAPKSELWRVVRVHDSGQVQLDEGMGRSAYLCKTADCLHEAQKKKRLGRSLRTAVPDTLYDQLVQRLAIHALSHPPSPES